MVADDLYLMSHHDVTGKPFLQPRPLGLGLAAALLAELMLGGGIGLRQDDTVMAADTWSGDDLTRRVHGLIAAEPGPHPVREWLLFLAQSAAGDVARRLERAGYVARVGGRFGWRSGRWVPVDPDWAFASLLRVRAALNPARPFAAGEAVLAGLAVASGLGFRLTECLSPAGRTVTEAVGYLRPDLRELILQTQAAVDSAVLSHRT